ncbi:4-hydroxybenzoate octaprenyltransferase [Pleomorphomonas koreensis]|uniref:4-hydroxybenzoate octaprenyltransferase n=1 Tax=Pleomorphomonas koreensis TaxID=257440 RepID=UPI000410FD19|nr:4-hydroxybenzoate octaprenyltransferase [Pleomorphomonas koreensis]
MNTPDSDDIVIPDAKRGNWVDRLLPAPLKPYAQLARWDRPIGWWLLLLPCWWSLGLASGTAGQPYPSPWYALLFFIGAVAMRGAGCTYNDIVDRHIDAAVARTRARPIPSGRVSAKAAAAFLVLQALVGLAVLLQFDRFSIGLGFCSMVPVAVYPFMKRITHFPQAVLGLSFSWGGLMGWSVVFGRLDAPALLIYVAAILWTFAYDTIYAHQDREDDALIDLGSTARYFAETTPRLLTVCYGAAVLLLGVAFYLADARIVAYVGLAAFARQLAWQVERFDADDGALCLKLFKSNRDAGLILTAGLVIDAFLKAM